MYQSIFSIDKYNKIIVECSEKLLKARLDHFEGVILQLKNQKIILEASSMICRFFLNLTDSLSTVLEDIYDPAFADKKEEYSLSMLINDYKYNLRFDKRVLFFCYSC